MGDTGSGHRFCYSRDPMRVCPQCGTRTPAATCPIDGLVTLNEAVLETSDPLIGRLVGGKYKVERHLGSGGMGAVYAARHVETGGLVAVKVLIPDRANRPMAIKRFSLEAQNAAALRHANTVRVLDFGADEDLLFLVMEFLEGRSLQDHLDRYGALDWQRAARIARQVLLALWEAHEHSRRIVHRDIKGANIFLCRQVGDDEFVKVVDFGVARSLEGSGAGTQGAIGTPHAMAPEQWSGDADARSDLYSVGCLCYELLTGRPVFEIPQGAGGNPLIRFASMHMIEAPPPLGRAAPDTPIGLQRLVHALLEKRPDDRPQRARDVIALLDRALAGDELVELAHSLARDEVAHRSLPPRRHPSSGARVPMTPPQTPGREGRTQDETIDAEIDTDAEQAVIATSDHPAAIVLAAVQQHGQPHDLGPRRVGTSTSPPPGGHAVRRTPDAPAAFEPVRLAAEGAQPQGQGAGRSASAGFEAAALQPPASRASRAAPRAQQSPSATDVPVARDADSASPSRALSAGGAASARAAPTAQAPGRSPLANWLAWTVLAVLIVGVGGVYLWRKSQAEGQTRGRLVDAQDFAVTPPPPPAPLEQPPSSPTTAKPPTHERSAGPGTPASDLDDPGAMVDSDPDARRPQVSYRAHLGKWDHRGRNGAKLRNAVDVLLQDRIHVHDGSHRDPLDTIDSLFGEMLERERLRQLLQKALTRDVSRRILDGEVDVEVQVWRGHAQVTLLRR